MIAREPQNVQWGLENSLPKGYWALRTPFAKYVFLIQALLPGKT